MTDTAEVDPSKRVFVYVRISSDPAGEKAGVRRQEEDCLGLADRRGWTVVQVFCDNDVSAYSGKRRPEYERMIEAIKNGEADGLIVWHPDRLHRSTRELDSFIGVVEVTGIAVATVQAGDYDLTTASGRMTARVVAAVDRHESEHKAERIRRKHIELAQAGKVGGGGTRPFGFERDRRTLRRDEAAHIRDAAKRILTGDSLRSIAREWSTAEITTPTGKPWSATPLKRMLTSPRIAGLREHRGEVVAVADWKPIIDRATHERLRGILLHPSRLRFDGSTARRYLLTGFLICGACGAKLVARPKNDKRRAYYCATGPGLKGCGKMGALAEPLEELVRESIFAALDGPAMANALISRMEEGSAEAHAAEALADARLRLDELTADYYGKPSEERMAKSAYLAALAVIEKQVSSLTKRLSNLSRNNVLASLPSGGEAVRQAWVEKGLDWQRTLLATVIEKVVINHGVRGRNRFDPDRFALHWHA